MSRTEHSLTPAPPNNVEFVQKIVTGGNAPRYRGLPQSLDIGHYLPGQRINIVDLLENLRQMQVSFDAEQAQVVNITPDGKFKIDKPIIGDESSVDVKRLKSEFTSQTSGGIFLVQNHKCIILHTHPSEGTFSPADLRTSVGRQPDIQLYVITPNGRIDMLQLTRESPSMDKFLDTLTELWRTYCEVTRETIPPDGWRWERVVTNAARMQIGFYSNCGNMDQPHILQLITDPNQCKPL